VPADDRDLGKSSATSSRYEMGRPGSQGDVRDVDEPRGLFGECVHEPRVGVADREHHDATREVEVRPSVHVDDAAALAPLEDDRRRHVVAELDALRAIDPPCGVFQPREFARV
jgi:hypothetical protein